MADGLAHTRKAKLTVESSKVTGSHADMPVLFTTANLPTEMFSGDYTAQSDGGDVRFSYDKQGNSLVPAELVSFSLSACEIWVKFPNVRAGQNDHVWVWWNTPTTDSQPAASASNGSEAVWSDYDAVFHMNDATTSTLVDSTSGGVTLTKGAANQPNEISSGKIGESQDFGTTAQVWQATGGDDFDLGNEFTVQLWHKSPANDGNFRRLISKSTTGVGWEVLHLGIFESPAVTYNRLYFTMPGVGSIFAGAADDYTADTWQKADWTVSTNAKEGLAYKDGQLTETRDWSPFSGPNDTTQNFTVGRRSDSAASSGAYTGELDEIRISSNVLSGDWLATEYESQNAPASFINVSPTELAQSVFPQDWRRQVKLTIQNTHIDADLTDMPFLITEDMLPSEMLDADGPWAAQDGGGDIRASTDAAGTQQLALEVVDFTTDNNPANATAELWIKVPSVASASDTDVYIWYSTAKDDVQPDNDEKYGRNLVWTTCQMACHLRSTTPVDSAGNHTLTVEGTLSTTTGPWGQNAVSFDGNDRLTNTDDALTDIMGTYDAMVYIIAKRPNNDANKPPVTFETTTECSMITHDNDGLRWFWAGSNIINESSSPGSGTDWNYTAFATRAQNSHEAYRDGASRGTSSTSIGSNIYANFNIGGNDSGSQDFDGDISDVFVFNTGQSDAWYLALYENHSDPTNFATTGTPEDVSLTVSPYKVVRQAITENTTAQAPNVDETFTGTTDTEIQSANATTNYGTQTTIEASHLGSPIAEIKTLIKFDLDNIPANATILSAQLRLYQATGSGTSENFHMSVYRLTRDWVEAQATWNIYSTGNNWAVAGAEGSADRATSASFFHWNLSDDDTTWAYFDLTEDVRDFVNSVYPNYGWVVEHFQGTALAARDFTSSEGTDAQRPELIVTYSVPVTVDIFDGLQGQWDVNTRRRTDELAYDHHNRATTTEEGTVTERRGNSGAKGNSFANNSNNRVRLNDPGVADSVFEDGPFTMVARYEVDAGATSKGTAFGIGADVSSVQHIALGVDDDAGNADWDMRDLDLNGERLNNAGVAFGDGVERVVAGTRTAADAWELFQDGASIDGPQTDATPDNFDLDDWTWGVLNRGGTGYIWPLDGAVFWSAFYNRVLTADEQLELVALPNPYSGDAQVREHVQWQQRDQTTYHYVEMPGTIREGDVLVMLFGIFGDGNASPLSSSTGTTNRVQAAPDGWTELYTRGYTGTDYIRGWVGLYKKVATAEDAGSYALLISDDSEYSVATVWAIANADIDRVDFATTVYADGSGTTTPDPPNLAHDFSAHEGTNTLWIAAYSMFDDNNLATGYPTDFGENFSFASLGAAGLGCEQGYTFRSSHETTVNPSSFTLAGNEVGVAFTIAVGTKKRFPYQEFQKRRRLMNPLLTR